MAKHFWSDAEIEALRAMRKAGVDPVEMAQRLDRSLFAVRNKLSQCGLDYKKAHGYYTAPEEVRLERLMAVFGPRAYARIGREMNRSADSVRERILKLQRQSLNARTQRRACMGCSRKFNSEGAHHRMCGACRPGNGLPEGW